MTGAGDASSHAAKPKNVPPPPFQGWADPALVFVFTGQQHGYLEPCGCSELQPGGMAQRADFLRLIREEKKWPLVPLDVGGTLLEERVARLQSRLKYDVILKGLEMLGYKGLQLGLEDLMLGPEKLYESDLNLGALAGESRNMPLMAANVMLLSEDLGMPVKSRLIEVGEVKIGVTGVVTESTRKKLEATGLLATPDFVRVDPVEAALAPVLADLKSQSPNLMVLLAHGEPDEARALAKQYPDFQIIVTAGGGEDPLFDPEWIGETLLVEVGQKGKNAIAVGYFPKLEKKLVRELVGLDAMRFKKAPEMNELMREYQQTLDANFAEVVQDLTVPDGEATFLGAESCKDCHTHAYKIWSTTKHSHAWDSLLKGHPGQEATWIERGRDPECLACHSTGWNAGEALRFASGFSDMESTAHLAGNQCENCHGAGSKHVELENVFKEDGKLNADLLNVRKALDIDLNAAKDRVCSQCHDHENSPDFNFETYWPKVNHSGKKD